jgi:hypothetical protein
MLKATVTYSSNLVEFTKVEVEMSHLASPLTKQSGLQVQFQIRDQSDRAQIICKGFLDTYAPWSESPTAQTLRVFHTLYTDWRRSVPEAILQGDVASMQISISYPIDDEPETSLTSMSLTRQPGTVASYALQRSVDGAASWHLEIRPESAVPLGIALKLLAFENSAQIDFSKFPASPQVAAHTDDDRRRMVLMSDLPDYAVDAFQAYIKGMGSYRQGDSCVPLGQWLSFLRS